MNASTEAPPRLFEVKGLGGTPPDLSEIVCTGVKREAIDLTITGQKIPKGATVKLTVLANVVAVGHRDDFEKVDGDLTRVSTTRVHTCKADIVHLESWTAPDDDVRFDGKRLGPILTSVGEAMHEAIERGDVTLPDGHSVSLTTADGRTTHSPDPSA